MPYWALSLSVSEGFDRGDYGGSVGAVILLGGEHYREGNDAERNG